MRRLRGIQGGDRTREHVNAPHPYEATKLATDQLLGFEATAHGLSAVSLRCFKVAGSSGRFGEVHRSEAHIIIPTVLHVTVGEQDSVEVYGTDQPTIIANAWVWMQICSCSGLK